MTNDADRFITLLLHQPAFAALIEALTPLTTREQRDMLAPLLLAVVDAERERCAQIAIDHARMCEERVSLQVFMDMPVTATDRTSWLGGAAAAAVIAGLIGRAAALGAVRAE